MSKGLRFPAMNRERSKQWPSVLLSVLAALITTGAARIRSISQTRSIDCTLTKPRLCMPSKRKTNRR